MKNSKPTLTDAYASCYKFRLATGNWVAVYWDGLAWQPYPSCTYWEAIALVRAHRDAVLHGAAPPYDWRAASIH